MKLYAPPGLTHLSKADGRRVPINLNDNSSIEVEDHEVIAYLEKGFTKEPRSNVIDFPVENPREPEKVESKPEAPAKPVIGKPFFDKTRKWRK